MKIRQLARYLRLRPFDTTTEEGRADERYRLALFAIGANLLSRAISMLVMILTVSLTIPYLGAERFGVWMTIASLAGMLTFLDLGVGNALTNKVAHAAARQDRAELVKIVSGGLGFLLLLAVLVLVVLNAVVLLLPWERLIKVSTAADQIEIRYAAHTFSVLFALTMFTTGVQRIFHGMQRGFEAHLFTVLGSIFSLGALLIAARQHSGIPVLLLSAMGGQIAANFLLAGLLVWRGQFSLRGVGANVRLEARHLMQVGGVFFLLQLGAMAGWGADSLIISSSLGAASVAMFNVTQRLFQLASQPLSIVNAPLWPAFADAHSHGDKDFIRKTLKKTLAINLVFGVAISLLVLALGKLVIRHWTHGTIEVGYPLLTVYAAWAVCDVVANAFAMFMNGCNIIRPQVYGVFALVVISIPLKLFLISRFGIAAMLLGFVIFFLINIAFWYGFAFKREIREVLL